MNALESKKIILEHLEEFPKDVKLAISLLLGNFEDLCRKKLRSTWHDIKARCYNKKSKNYPNYGGRGITMFPAWKNDFVAFYDYVSKLDHFGEKGYTLDRENVNGNYEPGNLRWADRKTQDRNKTTNILVEYQGQLMCLKDAAKKSGINYDTLKSRYKRGQELFAPVADLIPPVEYEGELISLCELSKKIGVRYDTLWLRYVNGKRGEELFAPSRKKV